MRLLQSLKYLVDYFFNQKADNQCQSEHETTLTASTIKASGTVSGYEKMYIPLSVVLSKRK